MHNEASTPREVGTSRQVLCDFTALLMHKHSLVECQTINRVLVNMLDEHTNVRAHL